MGRDASVDAAPAASWLAPRPSGLAPELWAQSRPTAETLARLALPDGAVVHSADGWLLGWESADGVDADLGGLWLRCARQFADTGLWPICDAFPLRPDRVWDQVTTEDGDLGWVDPYAVPTDVYDTVNLADRRNYLDDFDDEPGSFREFMEDHGLTETDRTLSEASALPKDPLSRLVAPDAPKRLTLVACRRPADAALLLDFGVANDDATPGIFTGVLRSWEARFGVVPVVLNPGWTVFQVLAPPTSETQIDRLAAEVFCFAADTAVQGGFQSTHGKVDARTMVQTRDWLIWWD